MLIESSDALRQAASRLLAADRVFAGLQGLLRQTLNARRKLERNVGRLLGGLNLPSQRDLERLFDHIQELESEIADITRRVTILTERLERPPIHDPGGPDPQVDPSELPSR